MCSFDLQQAPSGLESTKYSDSTTLETITGFFERKRVYLLYFAS